VSQLDDWNHTAASLMPGRATMFDRRQMLRLIGAIAAVGATGAAAACSTALPAAQLEVPTGRTITIGLIAPALGPYAKIGDDIQKGFKLFLADNDNLLGLNKVDLRTAEEGPTPESAVAAAQGLLQDGIIALAGMASGAGLAAVAPAMVQAQIPLVACSTAPTSLTPVSFLWRTASVEGEAGTALAPFARGEGTAAAMLYEDTSYAKEDAATFRRAFQDSGGHIVGDWSGKQNFSSRLQAAKTLGANVIFAAYSGADAVSLIEAYRTSNLNIKLIGPGSLTETADLSKSTNLPNNVYTAMYYAADLDNEANRRFVSSYFKTHDAQPSGYAMAAYDSASVLNKALRLVEGAPTGSSLNKAFSLLGQIESPRGVWAFNTNRGPQQRWYLRRLRLDGNVPANLLDTDLQVLS
jgi:branched-chain amino acid transport system substrate-binding protein